MCGRIQNEGGGNCYSWTNCVPSDEHSNWTCYWDSSELVVIFTNTDNDFY